MKKLQKVEDKKLVPKHCLRDFGLTLVRFNQTVTSKAKSFKPKAICMPHLLAVGNADRFVGKFVGETPLKSPDCRMFCPVYAIGNTKTVRMVVINFF
ncbi:hypothetical protein [Polaromonas sp. CG_9.11]|uniref:hypothetical protein n=1 Tax=Polaromonas sp. CG_9.11 TaxID=2787730 RepID=UPI0018CB3ECE|nr:hypothetical protein [Polaromonas sp. CG_9.11]MBG6076030.1 hypothetical protein [Polaromonas sp. CG_9.11]